MLQSGLADADDEGDFNVKLSSVKDIWEDIAPGFWDWFVKNHKDLFIYCLVLSARDGLGIEGRLYNNSLELKDKLQKKALRDEDIHKVVTQVKR